MEKIQRSGERREDEGKREICVGDERYITEQIYADRRRVSSRFTFPREESVKYKSEHKTISQKLQQMVEICLVGPRPGGGLEHNNSR